MHAARRAGPLEPLEPADRLVREPPDLGEAAARPARPPRAAPPDGRAETRSGSAASSSSAVCARASTCARARSSAASSCGARPGRPRSRRCACRARSRMPVRPCAARLLWPSDEIDASSTTSCREELIAQQPARAARRVAAARLHRARPARCGTGPFATCRTSCPASSWSSTTRESCRPGCPAPDRAAAGRGTARSSGRRRRRLGGARAAVAAAARRASASARSSCSSRSARAAGASGCDGEPGRRDAAAAVHPRAARRSRALPDGLRGRARVGGRADRRVSTSRPSCSRGSTSSA